MADDGLEFKPRDHITIPTPRRSAILRGKYATKKADPIRTIRMADDTWDTIHQGANALRMTASEFVRWVAELCANDVIGQRTAFQRARKQARLEALLPPVADAQPTKTPQTTTHVMPSRPILTEDQIKKLF